MHLSPFSYYIWVHYDCRYPTHDDDTSVRMGNMHAHTSEIWTRDQFQKRKTSEIPDSNWKVIFIEFFPFLLWNCWSSMFPANSNECLKNAMNYVKSGETTTVKGLVGSRRGRLNYFRRTFWAENNSIPRKTVVVSSTRHDVKILIYLHC